VFSRSVGQDGSAGPDMLFAGFATVLIGSAAWAEVVSSRFGPASYPDDGTKRILPSLVALACGDERFFIKPFTRFPQFRFRLCVE